MAEMKKIKLTAQKRKNDGRKRRAKLLAEFNRTGWTLVKLADKHGVTRARMGQLIAQAKKDTSLPVV